MKILNIGEFELGDTVQIIRGGDGNLNVRKDGKLNYGDIGTVCHILTHYCIGVVFDKEIMFGNDCQGACGNRRGFYYSPKNLLLIHDKVLTVKEWKCKNKIETNEKS